MKACKMLNFVRKLYQVKLNPRILTRCVVVIAGREYWHWKQK